jgi:autotransporter adhesin
MEFRTKLDYSDNRQIKQREGTVTTLSATTIFGMPFSALTSGPNLSTSAQTSQYFGVVSTYSGNSATTIFTWGIPNVSILESSISALTPSNSGVSQNISAVFGSSSSTVIDGNTVNLTYSGVSASNLYAITMSEPTPGNYTGTVSTDFFIFSAQGLDFTGRTIWVDNTEILRTKKLIVSNNPQIGYVLTCSDVEGMTSWQSVSAVTSGTTFWSASTGTNAIVVEYSDSVASGTLALAEGYLTTAIGNYSHAEGLSTTASGITSHAEGYQTTAIGDSSHVEGWLTTAIGNSSHAEGKSTTAIGLRSHAEGGLTIASGNQSHSEGEYTTANGDYSHSEGNYTIAIGNASHAEGSGTTASSTAAHAEGGLTTAIGVSSHAEGSGTTAIGLASHAEGRGSVVTVNGFYSHAEGLSTTAKGDASHVEGYKTTSDSTGSHAEGYQTIASGTSAHSEGSYTLASKSYAHAEGYGSIASGNGGSHAEGYASVASGSASHAEGSGTTASNTAAHSEGFASIASGQYSHAGGVSSTSSGKASFIHSSGSTVSGDRSVVIGGYNITGSADDTVYVPDLVIDGLTSQDPIATDANGKIVAGTSDIRLKQNINNLTNALDVVKNLRGVSFEYTEESNMGSGIRFGFIAQEVQDIVPDMVRLRAKGDGMLNLNYTEVIPWIVEAIKDLTKTNISNSDLILETQTIAAEDNNIELNYNGNKTTAIGGGITIINGIDTNNDAEFKINSDGDWITNNLIIPSGLVIPMYSPSSSSDKYGKNGEVTRDENYLYIKTMEGWKRSSLELF